MTITEESRYQLYKRLEATLGADDANTLMEHLPPVGWRDVATTADVAAVRSDLVQLEQRLALRFESLEPRFDAIDQRFEALDHRFDALDQSWQARQSEALHRQFVQTVSSMAALLTVMLSLAVAANQLLGG